MEQVYERVQPSCHGEGKKDGLTIHCEKHSARIYPAIQASICL